MLGYQSAHWDFKFNSDASLMEGNRIQDNGAGASPRFLTTGAVEGYSALDQYLMGLRAPGRSAGHVLRHEHPGRKYHRFASHWRRIRRHASMSAFARLSRPQVAGLRTTRFLNGVSDWLS